MRLSRLLRLAAVGLLAVSGAAGSVAVAPAASAHPLGNFTVNYASGLVVTPDGVRVDAVVDRAEISTLQAFPDAKPGRTPDGAAEFERAQCATLAAGARLLVGGTPVALTVTGTSLALLPGAAGLATARLECTLGTSSPVRTVGTDIAYQSPPTSGRVGWHEVTARGEGVRLAGSDVPATSPSQQLRQYPEDLLSSPLDQRTAALTVTAGTGTTESDGAAPDPQTGYGLDRLTTAYTELVSRATLTPAFALLAVLLSIGLGALHAFAPGHGKTLMAAYLVGRNGTWRQAAVIGLSVTVTHTAGVLLLGAALSAAVLAAPETVYPWLGLISGLLLAAIGVALLRSPGTLFAGHSQSDDGRGHGHGHGHGHEHEHEHGHGHGHGHVHGHESPASHGQGADVHGADVHGAGIRVAVAPLAVRGSALRGRAGTIRLALIGLVGGMVPSPSALLVLLGGIALGRAWFGALLVLAYGIGMAAALVATGLLLVLARDRVEAWSVRRTALRESASPWIGVAGRLAAWLPRLTAAVVLIVGLSLAARSAATL